jgi:hypothetical protein
VHAVVSSFVQLVWIGGTASPRDYPFVDFLPTELPQPSDLVRWEPLTVDPLVDGISLHPKAVDKLLKDREALPAFYDFPAEHWTHLRTTNPIESTFGTIRHRTDRAKGCVTRDTMLIVGVRFQDGVEAQEQTEQRDAA